MIIEHHFVAQHSFVQKRRTEAISLEAQSRFRQFGKLQLGEFCLDIPDSELAVCIAIGTGSAAFDLSVRGTDDPLYSTICNYSAYTNQSSFFVVQQLVSCQPHLKGATLRTPTGCFWLYTIPLSIQGGTDYQRLLCLEIAFPIWYELFCNPYANYLNN